MKKRALILSPFFFPEPISTGKYNTILATSLVKCGYEVHVITSYPIYPDWIPTETSATLEGVNILRGGKHIVYPKSQLIRRIFLEIWYLFFILKKIFFVKTNTLIIPVLPPSLFCILLPLIKSRNTKILGVVHDLQSVHLNIQIPILGHLAKSLIDFFESLAFKACDNVVFLSNEMKLRAIASHQNLNHKSSVIYPFYNETIIKDSYSINQAQSPLRNFFNLDYFNIVYSGALGSKQDPENLVKFFEALTHRNSDIHCHIFSSGPIYEDLKNNLDHYLSRRISLHDLVPESCLSDLYSFSDCQVIPQRKGTSSGSLPSKLPNIVISEVPIFCICDDDSEISHLIKNNCFGFSIHTWELESLCCNFEKFKEDFIPNIYTNSKKNRLTAAKSLFSINSFLEEIGSLERQ